MGLLKDLGKVLYYLCVAEMPRKVMTLADLKSLVANEQGFKPTPMTLFGNLPVLTGGTRTYEVAALSPLELARILEFLEGYRDKLRCQARCLAAEFEKQIPFFVDVASYAKARFDNKPYNEDEVAELPTAGQIGVQALIVNDLYDATNAPLVLKNTWDLNVVAGTPAYLFGGAAFWFFAGVPVVVERRCIIAIMKNGIIDAGTVPTLNQFQFVTAQRTYVPWRAFITRDVQIECDKPIYQYHTPGAMILTPDLGTRLVIQPTRTGQISPRLLGIVYGEYGYLMATGKASTPFRWNP